MSETPKSPFVGSLFTDTDLREILCNAQTCTDDSLLQIYPFSEDNLTPVGYDLRVGNEYTSTKKGKTIQVPDTGEVVISAGDTCLIISTEIIGMPKNRTLSGLIVSSVSMVAKGLSHISTSIDPDWSGRLMIVVHNHAPTAIRLTPGGTLCTAIFLSNRTPSTKACGAFADRNDIFKNRLLDATRPNRWRKEILSILIILIIPIVLAVGYLFFGNAPGLIASTAAGIAISGMLFTIFQAR